jgi:hypothetical protein
MTDLLRGSAVDRRVAIGAGLNSVLHQDFVSLAGAFKRQSQRPCECLSWCLPSEGRQARHGGDVAVVDLEAVQGVVQVFAEGVLAGAGDDRAAPTVAGRGHGHVGWAAPQVLAEAGDLAQRHPDLEGVDIDPDPSHRKDVEGRGAVAEHQDARAWRASHHAAEGPDRQGLDTDDYRSFS